MLHWRTEERNSANSLWGRNHTFVEGYEYWVSGEILESVVEISTPSTCVIFLTAFNCS